MALKDILSNARLGDDMVVTLNDGSTMTLGEIRGFTASERQTILDRQNKLSVAETQFTQRVNALRTAGLLDEKLNPVVPTRSEQEIKNAIKSETGLTEDDPLFGPILRQVKADMASQVGGLKSELESISNQVKQLATVTRQAVGSYVSDYSDRAFQKVLANLPESVRSKVTLDKALEFANQKKLIDSGGMPDLETAVKWMTLDDVIAAKQGEVRKTADDLEADRKALAQMGRPQMAGPHRPDTGFKGTDDKGRTLSLDEAIAAAASDDELWKSASKFVN